MSLFSNPEYIILTPIPARAAVACTDSGNYAVIKSLLMAAVLGAVLFMTVLSILFMHLGQVPSFPGTHTGRNHDKPRMVQALDTLQNNSDCFISITKTKGGEYHDALI
jgi:hypothetical protein